MSANDDFLHLVIGTAGHIDHGKSSLVERLTGTNPDTLREERERGLTIALGYATLALPDGRRVGVIDVPGHEKFVRTMVAGATAIDYVVFVVASDDGVMPQTREHLEILDLLGVRGGRVALTKIDAIDEEIVELAAAEVAEFLAGSCLDGAPIHRVSSIDGRGIEELRAGIAEDLAPIEPRSHDGPFRMPVQRAFSVEGHGTVVTGVPIAGRVSTGDTVACLPSGATARVRRLEAYGSVLDTAVAGHRTAIALHDVAPDAIRRGDWLAAPGRFPVARLVEGRFRYLASRSDALANRTPVRFHCGTAEALGHVVALDRREIEPGESALVQILLDRDLPICEGDPYVLRSVSPVFTLGGGRLIGTSTHRHRTLRPWLVAHLERKEQAASRDRLAFLAELVFASGRKPASRDELALDWHASSGEVTSAVARLESAGTILSVGSSAWIHGEIGDRVGGEVVASLEREHQATPDRLLVARRVLRKAARVDDAVLDRVLEKLEASGAVRFGIDGGVALASFRPRLSDKQQELHDRLERSFLAWESTPPVPSEIADSLEVPAQECDRMVRLLLEEERVVRLARDRIFHRDVVHRIAERLAEILADERELSTSEIREALDTSRRQIITILEYFDRIGITRRVGDARTLGPNADRIDQVLSSS